MDFAVFLLAEPYIFYYEVVMKLLVMEVPSAYIILIMIILERNSESKYR